MTSECADLCSVGSSCTRKSVGIKLRNKTGETLAQSEREEKQTLKNQALTHQFHTVATNECRLCQRLSGCEWRFHLNLGETTEKLVGVQPGGSGKPGFPLK